MNIFRKIFNRVDIKYDELINSELYLNSIWRIRYIKEYNGYALYNKNKDGYLDLRSVCDHIWHPGNTYFSHCITQSKSLIINKFDYIIKKTNYETLRIPDEERLDEFDIKTIEQYLRKKKLNKIK